MVKFIYTFFNEKSYPVYPGLPGGRDLVQHSCKALAVIIMNKYALILIAVFLSFQSCNLHDETKSIDVFDTVSVHYAKLSGDIYKNFTRLLKINSFPDRKEFRYYDLSRIDSIANDTFCEHYIIFKNFDSIILRNSDTCKLTSCKDFFIDNKTYRICKYYFDYPQVYDDEFEYLINDSLGLLQAYALAWRNYARYDVDSTSTQLNNLLLKDSSNFTRRQDNIETYEQELLKRLRL